MSKQEYERRVAEAWDKLEADAIVPSVADYLDAIRPIWREYVGCPKPQSA